MGQSALLFGAYFFPNFDACILEGYFLIFDERQVQIMTLEEMKAVDIRTVDPDTLVDVRDVHIDPNLPWEERMRSFLKQIKNPYVFKYKGVVIKTSFANKGLKLEDCLESYIRNR